MRILRLALAALTLTLASSAGTTIPALTLSCTPTPAGQSEPCTISSSSSQGLYVTFTTYDGTAKAGTDYATVRKMVYLKGAPVTVQVPTMVNPNATGTLSFGAAVTAGIGVTHATGSIVEPAAPPPPPVVPPPPPPPTTGVTLPNGPSDNIPGMADVPDGLDLTDIGTTANNVFVKAPANGNGTAAPDNVGAFRFICGPAHVNRDDPIMYPGQPGKSHLHQYYGMTDTDAFTTYSSTRTSKAPSTCQMGASKVLNRSAYWMPALLDGKGNVVRPDYVAIYYKRFPLSDPNCHRANQMCVPIPAGIKFIFGRDMTNMSAPPTGNFHFLCQTQGGTEIVHPTTSMDVALNGCPVGAQFAAIGDAPQCWDGKNLDSADHRSHVSYNCDATHPYMMPAFTIGARWTIAAGDDTTGWIFSSDVAMNQPRGSTFHADYFEGWNPTAKSAWTQNCIDRLLSCIGGQLGNGTGLPGGYGPTSLANPHLVPIPG